MGTGVHRHAVVLNHFNSNLISVRSCEIILSRMRSCQIVLDHPNGRPGSGRLVRIDITQQQQQQEPEQKIKTIISWSATPGVNRHARVWALVSIVTLLC